MLKKVWTGKTIWVPVDMKKTIKTMRLIFCYLYLTFYFQQIKRSKVSKAEKMLQIVPRLNRFLWHLSITSFIAKSSFHFKVQRSPSAHKDHPHTCQLGLCVRSMFKVRQKRKRRRGHAGCLRRKIRREHLDTCPSRWSSCRRSSFYLQHEKQQQLSAILQLLAFFLTQSVFFASTLHQILGLKVRSGAEFGSSPTDPTIRDGSNARDQKPLGWLLVTLAPILMFNLWLSLVFVT